MKKFRLSRFTLLKKINDKSRKFVGALNLLSGAFSLFNSQYWQEVIENVGKPTNDEKVTSLAKHNILVDETVDETALLKIWKQQYIHDTDTMKSRVLVGYDCNFRCVYCYLDPSELTMSAEIARCMDVFYIEHIKRINPRRCMDNYSGGEVLLNLKVALASASRRYHFCLGKGIPYEWGITTNGYLLSRTAVQRMLLTGLSEIRVSLLPTKNQNALRRHKLGEKTYDKIVSNLKENSDLTGFCIECQYDAGADDYKQIPSWLDDLDAQDINIIGIEFSPIFSRQNESRFLAGVGDPGIHVWLVSQASQRGFNMHMEIPASFCLADVRNYFVFDPAGNILPCAALNCGQLSFGNVMNGLNFVQETQILNRHLPDECEQTCDIAPRCFGGCRLQSFNRTGDFNGSDCQYEALKTALEEYIQARAIQELSRNPQFVQEADRCR